MKGWLPKHTFEMILKSMPIPCVDLVCVNNHRETLYGWRLIKPYKHVWAFPGGRILKGEAPLTAAKRHLAKYGIKFDMIKLNGVFNANFPSRSDISISFIVTGATRPKTFGKEFSRFVWKQTPPRKLGGIYRRMIQ